MSDTNQSDRKPDASEQAIPSSVRDRNDEGQTEANVTRTDVGVSIEYVSTRGTGTRDQDKVRTKVKGESLHHALEMSEGALRNHEKELKRLRKIQPDGDGS